MGATSWSRVEVGQAEGGLVFHTRVLAGSNFVAAFGNEGSHADRWYDPHMKRLVHRALHSSECMLEKPLGVQPRVMRGGSTDKTH